MTLQPSVQAAPKKLFRLRDYQRETDLHRRLRLMMEVWRRQGGKSTALSLRALRKMASQSGILVTFASASLLVGREIIQREAHLFRELLLHSAASVEASGQLLETNADGGTEDDFASIFEAGRLEVKLWHDRTVYSRTQVIAPNPATARGFSGHVMIDEAGWIRDFRDVWDAMEPIFSSDPTFTCLLATTPPADDTHFCHELIMPPGGTEFTPKAEGHWYRSESGLMVHRVDVFDAWEAGVKLYHPESGVVLPPEEHRKLSLDRESWDRNYALKLSTSGTAACSRLSLSRAQNDPESCHCIAVDDGEELPADWTRHISPKAIIGLGFDVATTENEKSNPSSFTVSETVGGRLVERLVWRWRTANPEVARDNVLRAVKDLIAHLEKSPRMLCIDATSERYFAMMLASALRALVPVKLVIASESLKHQGQKFSYKQYLGDLYVNDLDDGKVVLPSARWIFEDHRLVRKEKGGYQTAVDSAGNHGDTFDSAKLSHFALHGTGPAVAQSVPRKRAYMRRTRGISA